MQDLAGDAGHRRSQTPGGPDAGRRARRSPAGEQLRHTPGLQTQAPWEEGAPMLRGVELQGLGRGHLPGPDQHTSKALGGASGQERGSSVVRCLIFSFLLYS